MWTIRWNGTGARQIEISKTWNMMESRIVRTNWRGNVRSLTFVRMDAAELRGSKCLLSTGSEYLQPLPQFSLKFVSTPSPTPQWCCIESSQSNTSYLGVILQLLFKKNRSLLGIARSPFPGWDMPINPPVSLLYTTPCSYTDTTFRGIQGKSAVIRRQ
jgi:hypothetical protein